MKNGFSVIKRIARAILAPLRVIDDFDAIDMGLTEDDLLADLDPGWIEWREQLSRRAESMSEVA